MNAAVTGALVGLAFGAVSMFALWQVAAGIERKAENEEVRRNARLIRHAGWAELIVFLVLGYFVGPLVF